MKTARISPDRRVAWQRLAASFLWLPLAVGVASLLGCGDGRPKRVVVTGTVTYRGKPVEDANVTFVPKGGRAATGNTDAQGRFTLASFGPDDGAILGEHTVCIAKSIPDPNDRREGLERRMISVLPTRYASLIQPTLKATVTAAGPNDFRFDLTD